MVSFPFQNRLKDTVGELETPSIPQPGGGWLFLPCSGSWAIFAAPSLLPDTAGHGDEGCKHSSDLPALLALQGEGKGGGGEKQLPSSPSIQTAARGRDVALPGH